MLARQKKTAEAPGSIRDCVRVCIPDEPTRQYVYTPAWVDKIVKKTGTPETFEVFFGASPRIGKVTQIEAAPSKQEHAKTADSERAVG
jgi:hypothetical protein